LEYPSGFIEAEALREKGIEWTTGPILHAGLEGWVAVRTQQGKV
jgi:hypothetical protein